MTVLEWISTSRIYSDEENISLVNVDDNKFEQLFSLVNSDSIDSKHFIDLIKTPTLRDQALEQLDILQTSKHSLTDLLSTLFSRIGFEAGLVKRVLDENLISWGFFIDHNLFEPHCNAHPNNFLVLDLEADYNFNHTLLAPLDFDMTYDYQTFISTVVDNPETLGKQDRELFDSWSGSEKYELEKALGGDENMANFEYGDAQVKERSTIAKGLEIVMRDQCVLSYRRSYDKVAVEWAREGEKNKRYHHMLREMNAMVKLALIFTDHLET